MVKRSSTVMILPFARIRSAPDCARSDSAVAAAMITPITQALDRVRRTRILRGRGYLPLPAPLPAPPPPAGAAPAPRVAPVAPCGAAGPGPPVRPARGGGG